MVNGHNWNAAIYKGMCYTAAATTVRENGIMYRTTGNISKNEGIKKRIHTVESLNQRFCTVTGWCVPVIGRC